MFSINNLRIGSITPTDYFLGSVPIQKMYLGQICVFDRTEAERTVYTFAATSTTVTGNATGGSTEIEINSYKETYIGDTPQGDITRISLTDSWMSQFPDWCTPNVKSDSSNTTWTITLNFEQNTTSQARQANVTLTQQESNKQIVITVKQEAGSITTQYTLTVEPTEATLTGTDADRSTTFTVTTYKQQVINGEVQSTKTPVTISVNSGTAGEEGVSVQANNNNDGTYTATVTCMSTTQNGDYLITITQSESNKTATFTLHKVDPNITYSDISINTFTYKDTVSAAGETVTPTLSYSQTYGYDGSTTGGGTITSGATVTYSGTYVTALTGKVTIPSKGTTLSGETTATVVTVYVRMNGKSTTKTFTIKQEANTRTSELTDGVFTTAYSDFPAKGMNEVGWDRMGNCTHRPRAHWNYTSGATEEIDGSIAWINGTNYVIPNLGTTPTPRHRVLVWEEPDASGMYGPYDQWIWEDDDNGNLTNYIYAPELWQEENRIESTDYGDWTIEVNNTMSAQPSGGTLHFNPTISRTVTNTYTSEAVEETTENDNDNYTLSSNQTWAVVSDKSVVVSANDGDDRSAIITLTSHGVSEQITINQSSGTEITAYGDITISGGEASDISAAGGTSKAQGYTISQQVTYSNGEQETIDLTAYADVTEVSADSLGTTVKDRTKVGTSVISVSSGDKDASKSIDIYQQANAATYGEVTGGTGTANDILASGGTVKATVTKEATQTVSFTSGSTRAGNITDSSTEVSAPDLGTTVKVRTQVGTSILTFTGEGGKTLKISVPVYQRANEKLAGDITYGEWQVSVSANPTTVPNSGGTSTITRSAYRSKTQNYNYTSGATSTEKLSNETATPTLSSNQSWAVINVATVTISANNADTSRTVTITATHEGKQATCTITQGASVKVYSDLNVTGLTFKQLPASGIASGQHVAQSYVTGGTVTQTWGWNTTTGGGTLTWNLPADISEFTTFDVQIASTVSSLGTTEREEHTINDIFTVTISQNGKTYNASYDGVQEANVKTAGDKRYDTDIYNTKQNANISPASPWEFDVGTVKTKFRLGVPTYQKYTYTSGAESEEQVADTTLIPTSIEFVESSTSTPASWITNRTAIFDDPDYEYQYVVDNNITGYSRTADVVLYVQYPDQSLTSKLPITIHITQNVAPEMEYVTATVSNVVMNDAPASGISLSNVDNGGYNTVPNPSTYLKSCTVTVAWRYEGREDIAGNFVKYYPDDIDFLGTPVLFYCQYNTNSQNSDNVFVKNIDEKGTTVSGRTQIPYYVRVLFISIDGSDRDASGYSSAGVWYQEANQVESTTEEQGDKTVTSFDINNGTHSIEPVSGTLELLAVCSQTITTVKTYTSGAIGRDQSTNNTLKPAALESSQSWLTVPSVSSLTWDSSKNAYTGNVSVTANSGTDIRTAEVRCYPDNSKPSEYSYINIKQHGKTSTDSYSNWNFDEVKANTQTVTAAGGTVTLSGSAKRTVTHNWSDGTQTTSTETKALSECNVTVNNGATIDSNKTTVTIPANQTTSAKSYTITMVVSGQSSDTKQLTINQSADTYDSSDDTYGEWNVSVSASPQTIAYTGGTSTITSSATRTVTHHWVSGRTTNEQESGTPTLSGSATGFNLTGTTLTAQSNVSTYGGQTLTKDNDLSDSTANPNTLLAYTVNSYVDRSITASRSVTITATMDTKTSTVKVTQSGDPGGRTYYMPKVKTVESGFETEIKESEYEENKYDVMISVSKDNEDAFGTSYDQKLNTTVTITTDYPNSKTLDLVCGWTRFYIDGAPTRVELSPSNNNQAQFELISNGKWTIS